MLSNLKKSYQSIGHLLYPKLCLACRMELPPADANICTKCEHDLMPIDFQSISDNELTERFWGRLQLKFGFALYYFHNQSAAKALMHQLKYNNAPQVGIELGRNLGYTIRETNIKNNIDTIVPVPLHPKKKHLRGYNQSSKIAEGLSEILNIKWTDKALIRIENTTSQTQKTRMERFENVKNAFEIQQPKSLKNKHILLVDDVITTGATIEACALKLLDIPNITISIAAIGLAKS